MVRFFNKDEEDRIVAAIREAETATSGEIRVHVEVGARKPALEVAKRLFGELGMDQTQDRNAVLILLAVDRREFAIVGDEGINRVVPRDFWDEERDLMQQHFRRGDFATGIELAVQQIGRNLKEYFPYQSDDVNELPDEISYN
ncbi:putative membrane protein [Lewinella marina]|uniref:TPM domain-containing protein n=1 Tax=Neolewinella marina TaxID=438751 RepID=A0A2G0CEF6_9BACT|nr:TPM domain-containing protein [Neolewinella marina]NJB87337.1 putative membrane protein [Neolewinella marina]PHK98345.1 hypothetical protein CGL56_11640 [Neolewinella marina]